MNRFKSRITHGVLAVSSILFAAGCGSVVTTQPSPSSPYPLPTPLAPNTTPLFNPAANDPTQIPLPNDLLRSTTTGLDNQFPQTAPFNAEPFTSLAAQNGFSTTGNIVIPFSGGVVNTSINSSTLLLVEASTGKAVNCTYTVVNPFQDGSTVPSTVIIQPVAALKPLTEYTVIETYGIQGSGGAISTTNLIQLTQSTTPLVDANNNSVVTGVTNAQAQEVEPLREYYQSVWASAELATGTSRANLPFAFQFGTQPLFGTLENLRTVAATQNRGVVNSSILAGGLSPLSVAGFYGLQSALAGAPNASIGRICQGQFMVPNYIGNATTGYFTGSGGNITSTGDQAIPYWACLPANGTAPYPTLIFQHDITRSRNDVFAIANSACQAGYAVVAIDLVLHGNLSLNPAYSASSGTGFVNPASLRTFRDNIRQSAVDLFYVSQAIVSGQGDVDQTTPGVELATTKPVFIGQGVGAMVGIDAVAVDPNMTNGVFNTPGGRISNLLLNSPTFSAQLIPGLAAQGVVAGTTNFVDFWLIAQTVLDDADPMNYGTQLIGGGLKGGTVDTVLLQEAGNDAVIPASATNDLVASTPGLTQVGTVSYAFPGLTAVSVPFVGSAISQFAGAAHGFLLDPTAGNAALAQTQALGFLSPAGKPAGAVLVSP